MKFTFSLVVLSGLVCVHALTLSPEQKAKLKQYHAACARDTGVNQNDVKRANQGHFSEDPKFKEYVFCNLKKAQLVNHRGRLNEDVLMAKMPKDTNMLAARVITDLCKNQRGTNSADTAFQIYKCYYEATPQHVSLI